MTFLLEESAQDMFETSTFLNSLQGLIYRNIINFILIINIVSLPRLRSTTVSLEMIYFIQVELFQLAVLNKHLNAYNLLTSMSHVSACF